MIHYFQQIDRQRVVIFALMLSILGLFFSRILISVGMFILVGNAVIHPKVSDNLRAFLRSPTYLSITLGFMIVLLSGLYSSDLHYWLERLRIKLPFLLLPLAFAFVKPFGKRQFLLVLYFFFGLIVLSAIWVTIQYGLNLQEITTSYKKAKVIPTPINHIRFSLMIAFAIATGLYCYITKKYLQFKWEPVLLLALSVFLFGFLHLLAVRSGMLAAYIVLFAFVVYLIISKRQYLWGGAFLFALIALPVLAYLTMPTLQNKVKYMVYDLQQYYNHGKVKGLSDARRIYSLELGIKTGMQQPLIGVGYGDVKHKVNERYAKEYPSVAEHDQVLPHNQFVMVFAATGFIGLALFLWGVLYPILTNRHYREPLFLSLNLIILSSFMTEATVEVQLGTAFYLLFLLFLLKQPAFADQEGDSPASLR